MLLSLLGTIFLTIDKLMIAKMISFEALGLYGIAILASTYLAKFPASVGTVLLPNFQEKFGERENKRDLIGYLNKSNHAFSHSMPLVIGLLWFVAPFMVKIVLPDFASSSHAIKLLMLSSYFIALSQPYEHFIVAIKAHLMLFPIIVICICLAGAFNYVVLTRGWGIEGVATATISALALKFVMMFGVTCRHLFTLTEAIQKMAAILIKFSYLVIVLYFIEKATFSQSDFLELFFSVGLTFLCLSPFVVLLQREFDLKIPFLTKRRVA
jgi:O-antigen/teichoic acid export membrane protein